ncbi:MAG: nicotinamide riboside transporter PnuC [Flavisolibacter sp.]
MPLDKILEYIAVVTGIASVWFSKKENILVYPVGLINTSIYVYLSFRYDLIGESAVNLYYTLVSIYGWFLWAKKDQSKNPVLHISHSVKKQWMMQLGFFAFLYVLIFFILTYLKEAFYPGVIPWADALASASAFTGMWLMARKKVESWYWWILTNIISIPLYYIKGLEVTSVYYAILLVLAFLGLQEWKQKAEQQHKAIV